MKSGLGFYPGDFVFPLSIRILKVSGLGYQQQDICPTSSFNDNSSNASFINVTTNGSSTEPNSLFVTLTVMSELGDPGRAGIGAKAIAAPFVVVLLHAASFFI
jgi:hypothetical protein